MKVVVKKFASNSQDAIKYLEKVGAKLDKNEIREENIAYDFEGFKKLAKANGIELPDFRKVKSITVLDPRAYTSKKDIDKALNLLEKSGLELKEAINKDAGYSPTEFVPGVIKYYYSDDVKIYVLSDNGKRMNNIYLLK